VSFLKALSRRLAFGGAFLRIAAYDTAEAQAEQTTCYLAARAFRPLAFEAAGFPTRVKRESHLAHYCDIMNEFVDRRVLLLEPRYPEYTRSAVETITSAVLEISANRFQRRVHPFLSLLQPIPLACVIYALGKAHRIPALRVFEVGSGAGYLGALLALFGHHYCSMEPTQALFIWQDRLYRALFGTAFRQTAGQPAPASFDDRIIAIPWWHFATAYRRPIPDGDIVVCDRAMGEMTRFALEYLAKYAAVTLARSPVGAFLFTHIGEPRLNSAPEVETVLERAGFVQAQMSPVHIYVLRNKYDADPDKVARCIEQASTIGLKGELRGIDLVAPALDLIQESHAFAEFIGRHSDASLQDLLGALSFKKSPKLSANGR